VTLDASGEVVSVTVVEPRFTPAEKALLLASRLDERVPRGGHGHRLDEATDPAYQYAWHADLPTTDFAQEAINKAQDAYRSAYPDADMGALLWSVSRG